VYVTHDQVEAMTMGTRIAVMDKGLLQQVGSPQELYDRPTNRFVAGFIGSPAMNFADVTVDGAGGAATLTGSGIAVAVPAGLRASIGPTSGRRLVAGFRPEHLELGEVAEAATIRGTAEVVEYLGNEELLHVNVVGHEGDVVAIVPSAHRVRPGDVLDLKLPLSKLHLFDTEDGAALARV